MNYLKSLDYGRGKLTEDFPNKPPGFIEWLKEHPEYKLGLKTKEVELITCWNCGNEYPINYRKCPKCRAFNKKANENR